MSNDAETSKRRKQYHSHACPFRVLLDFVFKDVAGSASDWKFEEIFAAARTELPGPVNCFSTGRTGLRAGDGRPPVADAPGSPGGDLRDRVLEFGQASGAGEPGRLDIGWRPEPPLATWTG
jgi:hypothetical protein